jgi:predicted RNase H-like HicB family nuclease
MKHKLSVRDMAKYPDRPNCMTTLDGKTIKEMSREELEPYALYLLRTYMEDDALRRFIANYTLAYVEWDADTETYMIEI